MKLKTKNSLFLILALLLIIGCKKKKVDPRVPPEVVWKTGANYTATDQITVGKGDTLLIGIVAKKTEDDLKSFNVSYAYDGATTTATFYNYLLMDSEYESYTKDTQIIMRDQTGSEKWIFSIVDRDGNITQKTIICTVQ